MQVQARLRAGAKAALQIQAPPHYLHPTSSICSHAMLLQLPPPHHVSSAPGRQTDPVVWQRVLRGRSMSSEFWNLLGQKLPEGRTLQATQPSQRSQMQSSPTRFRSCRAWAWSSYRLCRGPSRRKWRFLRAPQAQPQPHLAPRHSHIDLQILLLRCQGTILTWSCLLWMKWIARGQCTPQVRPPAPLQAPSTVQRCILLWCKVMLSLFMRRHAKVCVLGTPVLAIEKVK